VRQAVGPLGKSLHRVVPGGKVCSTRRYTLQKWVCLSLAPGGEDIPPGDLCRFRVAALRLR